MTEALKVPWLVYINKIINLTTARYLGGESYHIVIDVSSCSLHWLGVIE